jgi:hypothetical protein
VRCLSAAEIHDWARPLAIDFDWVGFYSLLYARTGWRDVFFLEHTGIVCSNPHEKVVVSGAVTPVLADPHQFGPPRPATDPGDLGQVGASSGVQAEL